MRILVTGATRGIGRRVVDHLVERVAGDVRALTIDPAAAALPAGVEAAVGSLRRPATLASAFAGVDAVYLAPTPETVDEVLAIARAAGVTRVVDLSGEHESWWGRVAIAVEESGMRWTHLSPGDFMENTLSWAPQILATDEVREPYPDGRSTPIAMDDIARVAAAALLSDRYDGIALSLTGPEVLTRVALADAIGVARGRPVRFVTATPEESAAALEPAMGANARWYVDTVLVGNTEWPVAVLPTVEEVTGAPATRFAEWAHEHRERFLP